MSDILDDNKIKENLQSLNGWVVKNNLLYKKFSLKTSSITKDYLVLKQENVSYFNKVKITYTSKFNKT